MGGVIPVQELVELLTNIHDILDNAISKWVRNMSCIWYLFLILFPGIIMESELHSTPFVTLLRTLFLLVKLAFIATSTGL